MALFCGDRDHNRCSPPPKKIAAYFAPYSYEQHQALVAEMQTHELVTLEMLGESLDGHDLDLLRVGKDDSDDKRRIWVLARQHPGESMAGAREGAALARVGRVHTREGAVRSA